MAIVSDQRNTDLPDLAVTTESLAVANSRLRNYANPWVDTSVRLSAPGYGMQDGSLFAKGEHLELNFDKLTAAEVKEQMTKYLERKFPDVCSPT